MLCEDCLRKDSNCRVCDCCGSPITDNESTYFVQDYALCERCLENHTSVCEECEETFFNDNIEFYPEYNKYLCHDCYEELKKENV